MFQCKPCNNIDRTIFDRNPYIFFSFLPSSRLEDSEQSREAMANEFAKLEVMFARLTPNLLFSLLISLLSIFH